MIEIGVNRVARVVGFAVDRCPTCQAARVCEITAVGRRMTVFLVFPASRMIVLGHQAKCQECHREFEVEPAYYDALSERSGTVAELTPVTNTALAGVGAGKKVLQVIQACLKANQDLAQRFSGGTVIDLRTGLAIVSVFAVLISAIWIVGNAEWVAYVWGSVLIAAMVNVVFSMVTVRSRFIRGVLIPGLRNTLRALTASPTEVEKAFARLQRHGYELTRFVQHADLR